MAYKCHIDGRTFDSCAIDTLNPSVCNCAVDLLSEDKYATKWDCWRWREVESKPKVKEQY